MKQQDVLCRFLCCTFYNFSNNRVFEPSYFLLQLNVSSEMYFSEHITYILSGLFVDSKIICVYYLCLK